MNKSFNLETDFKNYSRDIKEEMFDDEDIFYYQSFRYFQDEFPEQEELRNDFLLNYFSLKSEIELADYWLEKRFNERN